MLPTRMLLPTILFAAQPHAASALAMHALSRPPIQSVHRGGVVVMKEFSQKTKLRGEIENPFAKLRLFALPAAFTAAGIATYFAVTALIAELAGLRPSSPDTFTNLFVDLASAGTIGYFWRREVVAEDKRLRRIDSGAAISSLRVQLLGGSQAGKATKLAELRSGRKDDPFDEAARRVVVVCADEPALAASLAQARTYSRQLVEADLLIVPLLTRPSAAGGDASAVELPPPSLIKGDEGGAAGATDHIALPQGLSAWSEVLADEQATAAEQDKDAARRGVTLILKYAQHALAYAPREASPCAKARPPAHILTPTCACARVSVRASVLCMVVYFGRKNGRVGTRRLGLPDWQALVSDVSNRAAAGLDTRNI